MLNSLFLRRLMIHADGFASDAAFQDWAATPVIDTSAVFYDGNSQGGIFGGVLAAFAQDITRVSSLGVPGMNYSHAAQPQLGLRRPFDDPATRQVPDELDATASCCCRSSRCSGIAPTQRPRAPHDRRLRTRTRRPRRSCYQVAFGDHQVAPVTARSRRAPSAPRSTRRRSIPGKVVPEVTPYYGIPAIPSLSVRRLGAGDLGFGQSGSADRQHSAAGASADGCRVGRSRPVPAVEPRVGSALVPALGPATRACRSRNSSRPAAGHRSVRRTGLRGSLIN